MTIKLFDWLMMTDNIGISTVVIYQYDDDIPLYTGSIYDVPYWAADLYIAKDCGGDGFEEPISYRTSLGDDYQNKPGWVIVVTDNKDEAYKLRGGE